MPFVKKQHYVPQFYLKRFADSNSLINVFDKFSQKSFRANVRDIASSNYFYDLSQDFIQELEASLDEAKSDGKVDQEIIEDVKKSIREVQIIEERLSRMEGRFAHVLDKVLKGLETRKRFKHKFRSDLALFLAVQFWRTNEQRQSMMEIGEKLEEGIMKMVQKMNEVKGTNLTAEDVGIAHNPEMTSDQHRMLLIDYDNLFETANIFNSHIWIIGVNDTNNPFYTSDHPVAKRAHKTDDWKSNAGIASPGIEIMFPLSPKYMLTMVERTFFSHLEKDDGKLMYLKKDDVTYTNSHQVYSSYRQVYSTKRNFDLVEEMLKGNPKLTQPQSRWK